MPLNQQSRSRKEILSDYFEPDDESKEELPDDYPKEFVNRSIALENELLWAFHRDPREDLTQVEAIDRAISWPNPEYGISQSTASRILNDLDDRMLTEPILHLNMDKDGRGYEDNEYLSTYPREYLEAFRELIAMFIVDKKALGTFLDPETPTPDWARRRFPSLDPNIGRYWGKKRGYEQLHEKQSTAKIEPVTND